MKMGENLIMKSMFFSNTHWTQLLVPLEILMSKISLKYIPIHIYNFEHSRVIMIQDSRFYFICHIHNYTEYNQQWNVSQVRSMDSAIIWNTNTKNIHKYKKMNEVENKKN